MLIHVRTTLVIDDHLFRAAKELAAARGVTLSELLNEALRAALAQPERPAPRFQMITYGGGDPAVHHEPADLAAAIEEDDRSSVEQ